MNQDKQKKQVLSHESAQQAQSVVSQKKHIVDDKPFSYWLEKNHYYHHRLKKWYRFAIPEGARVLMLHCRNGYLLDAVKPAYGVGIDSDAALIKEAQEAYPRYQFYAVNVADLAVKEPFDYIVLSSLGFANYDLHALLASLKPHCHAGTRIILDTYSYFWEPFLKITQRFGLSKIMQTKNWISVHDVQNLLYLAGYQQVSQARFMLFPVYVPLLSTLCNTLLAQLPLVNRLCLHQMTLARPFFIERNVQEYTVSVIIPCHNQKGNIEALVKRIPQMGKFTELIFIECHSQDGTLDELHRVIKRYPDRALSVYVQSGKGRGDALRMGFDHALGDILITFDADLTVQPEELLKCYYALLENKGECITGTRLLYDIQSSPARCAQVLMHLGFGKVFSWLLGQKINDLLCGVKVLWKDDYKAIVRNRSLFGDFDTFGDFDLLLGAAKLHLKCLNMPVHYSKSTRKEPFMKQLYHGWILMLMSLIALKRFKLK